MAPKQRTLHFSVLPAHEETAVTTVQNLGPDYHQDLSTHLLNTLPSLPQQAFGALHWSNDPTVHFYGVANGSIQSSVPGTMS